MYLCAILVPPVAVLLYGQPRQALVNLALTACIFVPGVIHAISVVNEYKNNKQRSGGFAMGVSEGISEGVARAMRESRRQG